ncbi:hypothetical protein [Ectobacillus polymachus]|uniref:hypothetical protein n=1 Tax=Ectobacillus polymachus TaxID=1508806 RepID=UPI003A87F632
MCKSQNILVTLAFVFICIVGGLAFYKWWHFGTIDGGTIFSLSLAFAYFFNVLNWRDHRGRSKKDELDHYIIMQSAKISYFALLILSGIILFFSEGKTNLNEIKNVPLLIVVCLGFVILPITEFFYSRKFK